MTTTMKTTGALLLAALLTGLLFISPVGISNAQDADRPQQEELTDEDR